MDNETVRARLLELDEVLAQLELVPGATAEKGLDAVRRLAEVYGEALRRVATDLPPDMLNRISADELVGHLLELHDVVPPRDKPFISAESLFAKVEQ